MTFMHVLTLGCDDGDHDLSRTMPHDQWRRWKAWESCEIVGKTDADCITAAHRAGWSINTRTRRAYCPDHKIK